MINRIASYFYRDKTLNEIEKRIKLLGINSKYNAISFMNFRVFSSILIFIIILKRNIKKNMKKYLINYIKKNNHKKQIEKIKFWR